MQRAFAVGIPPWRFWDLTYREFHNAMEGADIRDRMDRKRIAWGHWHGSNWAKSKKNPPLLAFLRKLDPRPALMDNRSLREAIMDAAKALGATVVRRKVPKKNRES